MQFDSDIIIFNIKFQLKKLLYSIQKLKSAIYPISGLKQVMLKKTNVSYELISFKLYDGYVEREVDDNEVIKLLLIIKNVIKWLNVTWYSHGDIKDFFIEYLKKIPIIISSNYYDPKKTKLKIITKKFFVLKNLFLFN